MNFSPFLGDLPKAANIPKAPSRGLGTKRVIQQHASWTRSQHEVLGVLGVFLGIFEKTKEKKDWGVSVMS